MVNTLLDETWKPIHETNDRYFISNKGRFKHYKNGLCNLKKTKTGLLYLHIKINKKDISLYQYRTMYKYFVSDKNIDDYIVLLKENCELKPENLYLVSKKQSNRTFFGKNVYVYDTDLSLVAICNSCSEAAEMFNTYDRSSVSRVCNNLASHANNYIFSYVELSTEELVIRLNNIIMSYFNQCHKSEDSDVCFDYSDIGIITKIYLSREISYKSKDSETQRIIFNPKDWLKHNSKSKKYQSIKAKGKLKSISKPPSMLSEQRNLKAYVYDGCNARFLFSDIIYNVSNRLECSCENIRFHIKNKKLSYSIVNKHCYIILASRDDASVREFVRTNVPPGNVFKDENIRKRYYGMLNRCYCKTQNHYEYYGGKGITVFDDWRVDGREFEYFCINNGFNKNLEIDRINPDYGYEPWNVQFISQRDNKIKMSKDRNRTELQVKIDKIKYLRRKSNFLKNYRRGEFVDE